jgi:hypothetical protein
MKLSGLGSGLAALDRPTGGRAIMLIECLVYMAVFFVVTGLAGAAFYQALETSRHLRRNTGDIALVLEAGENWRAEIRRATGPVRLVDESGVQALHIPQGAGELVYFHEPGTVSRRRGDSAPWARVLGELKSSRFVRDERQATVSWRWEIELRAELKSVRVRPLFSFQAVAPGRNP